MSFISGGQTINKSMNGLIEFDTGGGVSIADDSITADGSITCKNLFATNETFLTLPLCNVADSGTNNLLLINRACGNLVYPQLAYDNTFTSGLNTFQTAQANTVIAGSVKCQGAINFDTEGIQGFKTSMSYVGGVLKIANNISTGFAPYITFSVVGDAIRIGDAVINIYKNLQIAGTTAFQNAIPYCAIVPTLATDLVNKLFVDTSLLLYVLKTSLTTTLLDYAKLASNNIFTGNNTFQNITSDKLTITNTTVGPTIGQSVVFGAAGTANNISFTVNAAVGYNTLIQTSDCVIMGGPLNAANLVLCTHSSFNVGMRITPQSITAQGNFVAKNPVAGPTIVTNMTLASAGTAAEIRMVVNAANPAFNEIIKSGDAVIYGTGGEPGGNSNFCLTLHSNTPVGMRITPTDTTIYNLKLNKPTPQIYTAPLPSFTNCIGETYLSTFLEKNNTGNVIGGDIQAAISALPALGLWRIDFQYNVTHSTDNIYTIGIYINGVGVEESRSTHYCPTVSGSVNFAMKTSFTYLNTVVNTGCGGYVKSKSVQSVPITSAFLRVTRIG